MASSFARSITGASISSLLRCNSGYDAGLVPIIATRRLRQKSGNRPRSVGSCQIGAVDAHRNDYEHRNDDEPLLSRTMTNACPSPGAGPRHVSLVALPDAVASTLFGIFDVLGGFALLRESGAGANEGAA